MSKMMIYALKGAVGGSVENVWGHDMQVIGIESSNLAAVEAAKANGYSNNAQDIIEQIEAKKMQRDNDKMKGQLSSGADKKRIKELEGEVEALTKKLAVYETAKDINGEGMLRYDAMTNAELQALLEQRKVDYGKRDSKDTLIQKAIDSE